MSHLETQLSSLYNVVNAFNSKLNDYKIIQADHFFNIRNDIDIRRESLLNTLMRKNSKANSDNANMANSVDNYIHQIHSLSILMIKQTEEHEKAFSIHCDSMLPSPFEFNFEIQREKISKDKNYHDYVRHQLMIASRVFALVDQDMKRNRFESCMCINKIEFGCLKIFKTFLKCKLDIVDNLIICANKLEILNLEHENWPNMAVNTNFSQESQSNVKIKFFVVWEKTKAICVCYGENIFEGNNSIRLANLRSYSFEREYIGHTDIINDIKIIKNFQKVS